MFISRFYWETGQMLRGFSVLSSIICWKLLDHLFFTKNQIRFNHNNAFISCNKYLILKLSQSRKNWFNNEIQSVSERRWPDILAENEIGTLEAVLLPDSVTFYLVFNLSQTAIMFNTGSYEKTSLSFSGNLFTVLLVLKQTQEIH